MKIHIKNGRLIDPTSKIDKPQDLFIAAGRIVGVGNTAPSGFEANSVLDATGCAVCSCCMLAGAKYSSPAGSVRPMEEAFAELSWKMLHNVRVYKIRDRHR